MFATVIAIISVQLIRIQVINQDDIIYRTALTADGSDALANPRVVLTPLETQRGEIVDRDGQVIAGTVQDGDHYYRTWPNPATAYVGGYYSPFLIASSGLEATYADTLILSAERELFRRTSLELTWVDKETADIFEDTCDGNLGGVRVPGHACTNFALANLPELRREYQGAILQAESRALDWLHVVSSLTWSESKG